MRLNLAYGTLGFGVITAVTSGAKLAHALHNDGAHPMGHFAVMLFGILLSLGSAAYIDLRGRL